MIAENGIAQPSALHYSPPVDRAGSGTRELHPAREHDTVFRKPLAVHLEVVGPLISRSRWSAPILVGDALPEKLSNRVLIGMARVLL